ncbi:MAG: sigma-54 factor interaction domain-containing protein, partial [Holophagales bacterium]|nr:sigma-54 factor interaction domain-containing protein [Holophagales bacterium]
MPSYHEGILGRSPELLDVLSRIDRLAVGRMPVLVLGESGTGKELMARRVHQKSPRSSAPFVEVPCSALNPDAAARALYGSEGHPGRLQLAAAGSLFLEDADRL